MTRVDLALSARRDLREIGDYIGRDDPKRALRFLEQLNDVFDRLARMPLSGRSRSEIRIGLRSVVHRDYVVFYTQVSNGISVIRVVHGRRDIGALFR